MRFFPMSIFTDNISSIIYSIYCKPVIHSLNIPRKFRFIFMYIISRYINIIISFLLLKSYLSVYVL